MQSSLEFGLPAARPQSYVRRMSPAAAGETLHISFKLVVLFLLMLYSSIAVIYPQLNAVRPALVIGVGAIVMLVVELAQTGQSFKMMWPQGYLLITFLGISFISSFNALYARRAFDTTSDLWKIVLIYFVIENTVTSESRLRKIFLTLVVGGLFPAIGTIHHYMHGILIEGSRASWVGVFKNPNEDAYSLAVLVPIAAALGSKSRWFGRVLMWGVIGIYLTAIYLTFSRGGLVGLLAVLGLIGWKQKSFVLRVLMIAAIVATLSFGGAYWARNKGFDDVSKDVTFNQRIATIKAGVLMFMDYPLLGVGPGCSIVAYPLYVPDEYLNCGCQPNLVIHNSFIQVLSELGGLGFILFMGLLGVSILEARRMQAGPIKAYAAGLEIALWAFAVCSLTGGYTYGWWPYILFGLVVAARRVSDHQLAQVQK